MNNNNFRNILKKVLEVTTILDELSHNFGLTSLKSKTRSLLIGQSDKESGNCGSLS